MSCLRVLLLLSLAFPSPFAFSAGRKTVKKPSASSPPSSGKQSKQPSLTAGTDRFSAFAADLVSPDHIKLMMSVTNASEQLAYEYVLYIQLGVLDAKQLLTLQKGKTYDVKGEPAYLFTTTYLKREDGKPASEQITFAPDVRRSASEWYSKIFEPVLLSELHETIVAFEKFKTIAKEKSAESPKQGAEWNSVIALMDRTISQTQSAISNHEKHGKKIGLNLRPIMDNFLAIIRKTEPLKNSPAFGPKPGARSAEQVIEELVTNHRLTAAQAREVVGLALRERDQLVVESFQSQGKLREEIKKFETTSIARATGVNLGVTQFLTELYYQMDQLSSHDTTKLDQIVTVLMERVKFAQNKSERGLKLTLIADPYVPGTPAQKPAAESKPATATNPVMGPPAPPASTAQGATQNPPPVPPARVKPTREQLRAEVDRQNAQLSDLLKNLVTEGTISAQEAARLEAKHQTQEDVEFFRNRRMKVIPISKRVADILENARKNEGKNIADILGLNPKTHQVKVKINTNSQHMLTDYNVYIAPRDTLAGRVGDFTFHTTTSMAKFAVAEGMIAASECLFTQDMLPCTAWWEHATSISGAIGFAGFSATSHLSTSILTKHVGIGPGAAGMIGMALGMAAQNIIGQLTPGLEKLRSSLYIEDPVERKNHRAEAMRMLVDEAIANPKWWYDKIPEFLPLAGSVWVAKQAIKGVGKVVRLVAGENGALWMAPVGEGGGAAIAAGAELAIQPSWFLRAGRLMCRATMWLAVAEGVVEIVAMLEATELLSKWVIGVSTDANWHAMKLQDATRAFETTMKLYQNIHLGVETAPIEGVHQLAKDDRPIRNEKELSDVIAANDKLKATAVIKNHSDGFYYLPNGKKFKHMELENYYKEHREEQRNHIQFEVAEWTTTKTAVSGSVGVATSYQSTDKSSGPVIPLEIFEPLPAKENTLKLKAKIEEIEEMLATAEDNCDDDCDTAYYEKIRKDLRLRGEQLARAERRINFKPIKIVQAKALELRMAWDAFRGSTMKFAEEVFSERLKYITDIKGMVEAVSMGYDWINDWALRKPYPPHAAHIRKVKTPRSAELSVSGIGIPTEGYQLIYGNKSYRVTGAKELPFSIATFAAVNVLAAGAGDQFGFNGAVFTASTTTSAGTDFKLSSDPAETAKNLAKAVNDYDPKRFLAVPLKDTGLVAIKYLTGEAAMTKADFAYKGNIRVSSERRVELTFEEDLPAGIENQVTYLTPHKDSFVQDGRWKENTDNWKELVAPRGTLEMIIPTLGQLFGYDATGDTNEYYHRTKEKLMNSFFCGPEVKMWERLPGGKKGNLVATQNGRTLVFNERSIWIDKKYHYEKKDEEMGPRPPKNLFRILAAPTDEDLKPFFKHNPNKEGDLFASGEAEAISKRFRERGLPVTQVEDPIVDTDAVELPVQDLWKAGADFKWTDIVPTLFNTHIKPWRVVSIPGLCIEDYGFPSYEFSRSTPGMAANHIGSFIANLKKFPATEKLRTDFSDFKDLEKYVLANCKLDPNFCTLAMPTTKEGKLALHPDGTGFRISEVAGGSVGEESYMLGIIDSYLYQLRFRHLGKLLVEPTPLDGVNAKERINYGDMIAQSAELIMIQIAPTLDRVLAKYNETIRDSLLTAIYGESVSTKKIKRGTGKFETVYVSSEGGGATGFEQEIMEDTGKHKFDASPGPRHFSGFLWLLGYHAGLPKGFYSGFDAEAAYWRNLARLHDYDEQKTLVPIFDEMVQTLYTKKRMTDQFVKYLLTDQNPKIMNDSLSDKLHEMWSRFVLADIDPEQKENAKGSPAQQYFQDSAENSPTDNSGMGFQLPEGVDAESITKTIQHKIETEGEEAAAKMLEQMAAESRMKTILQDKKNPPASPKESK